MVFIGIVAATMSTADNANVAVGTVMVNSIFRQFDVLCSKIVHPDYLFTVGIPRTIILPFHIGCDSDCCFYSCQQGRPHHWICWVFIDFGVSNCGDSVVVRRESKCHFFTLQE